MNELAEILEMKKAESTRDEVSKCLMRTTKVDLNEMTNYRHLVFSFPLLSVLV